MVRGRRVVVSGEAGPSMLDAYMMVSRFLGKDRALIGHWKEFIKRWKLT